jgi:iron complex transport system substrate-binding protein
MLDRYVFALVAIQLAIAIPSWAQPTTPPQPIVNNRPRVITLTPHLAEIIHAAGGTHLLVGVSAHSNHPSSINDLPIISDAKSIDLERIKKLQPTLIIYWESGTPNTQIAALKKYFSNTPTKILGTEPRKLDDIAKDIDAIGQLLGTEKTAQASAKKFRAQVKHLEQKYNKNISHTPHVRVFYQVWSQPLMTLNREHLIGDIIQLCGGEQLFAKEKPLVSTISRESAVKADPEIIFTATDNPNMRTDWSMWSSLPNLSATKNQAFIEIDGDTISRPSPQILLGAEKMCAAIEKVGRSKYRSIN